ncbi:MAG: cysteine desulfurase-like protein, partial [Acidobacteria bacterium]|nr:cysteine desulfurase-like protein [Acidobacteriota bacterium]
ALVGADDPDEIVFGANMTTLTMALARALARTWSPGDEILVTRADHDANVAPWLLAARDAGATARFVEIRRVDGSLDLEDLARQLTRRTRLVAVGCASNAIGTIHPVGRVAEMAHAAGALVFLDAVHYAPHALLDVAAWDCDFLACSAYKFFGPHVGVMWGRRALLEAIPVYKVRPASDDLPARWETGTLHHEGIAGTLAAIDYLADLGRAVDSAAAPRREAIVAAFGAIQSYEQQLSRQALARLAAVPGLTLHGVADPARVGERTPTFAITLSGTSPAELAKLLAARGIFTWAGNFYALALTTALGLEPHGVLRAGFLHYNTPEEVERLGDALQEVS